ncbi:MAG: hypothetical protein PUG60_04805 [Lachnospiraceae bacterium]|nr:hypothetical protein [Lachnospiraceae bacterium]
MKKTKKLMAFLMAACLAVGTLAGCGGTKTSDDGTAANAENKESTEKKNIRIR